MTVITLNSPIAPGNFINTPDAKKGEYLELLGYKIVHALGFAEIDSTGGTSFPVRLAPDVYLPNADGNQITIPSGAMVLRTAFGIPAGLSATDGDNLLFAGAIDAASTAGTNVAVASAAAASSTYAAASAVSQAPLGAYLGVAGASTALAADLALNILSEDGAGAAGAAVSAASGTVRIPCEVIYAVSNTDAPSINDVYPQSQGRTDITSS